MEDNDFERERALRRVYEDMKRSFRENPPKDEIYEMLNHAMVPKPIYSELVRLKNKPNITQQEIDEVKEMFRKEKARQVRAREITRRKNQLAQLEKEIRSNRNINKLQKMLQIREIQRQRSNL